MGMSREEAIEVLQQDIPCEHDTDLIEALDMAIEALEQQPCTDAISRQAVLDLAKFDGRENLGSIIHAFDVEQLPPVNPAEKQEPCKDTISREAVIDIIEDVCPIYGNDYRYILRDKVNELPPVTPQYTDAEIQKMQDLESVEIQTAYEIGKAEGSEVLDKIRAEIDSYCGDNRDRNDGLYIAMRIIDKYKASPTGAERSEE